MATTPTPDPTLAAIQTALTTGIKFSVTGTLPGEALLVGLFDYLSTVRKTTDPALIKEFDAIGLQMVKDIYGVWRNIWVALGVVK